MNEFLLKYAIDNIWCNPTQDKQFVYKLRKLTPRFGVRSSYVVEQERYALPTSNTKDYWHVYQIGQVSPSLVGFPNLRNQWMALSTIANECLTLVEVYSDTGIQYPKGNTYVLVTQSRNLLIAVKNDSRFPDLDEEGMVPFLRVYSNSYFQSERSSVAGNRSLIIETLKVNTDADLRQFQIKLMDLLEIKGGLPVYLVNGRIVQEISLVTATVGDYCEFILDHSVKRIVDLPIKDLKVFNSTLDTERKYILHYGKDEVFDQTIDFYDDLDVYVCKKESQPGRFHGLSYHRNNGKWLRMLTHKDYSISVTRLTALITGSPEDSRYIGEDGRWQSMLWTGIDDKFIKLIIRHGGYERPLVADVNRTKDLYRLKSSDIIRAMTGEDGVAEAWRAENLEKSAYVKFMSAEPDLIYPITFNAPELTSVGKIKAQDLAGAALGYHSCASLMSNNPTKVIHDGFHRRVTLPYNYWKDTTVFEFDDQGILLGHYYHTAGEDYIAKNPTCYKVEAITGKGSIDLKDSFGSGDVNLKDGYNFRLYITQVWAGVPTNEWIDISSEEMRVDYGYLDDTDLYNPKWVWTYDPKKWYGCVRTDRQFYLKEMSFNRTQGIIRFNLDNWELHNGELINKQIEIPFGQLDLFINGRPVIETLDYAFINNICVINNLEYLNDDVNVITVRGTGFCTDELKRYTPREIGWVEYGVISNNDIYDIHTNKMQRIIVDGHYRSPDDVVFDENHNDFIMENERNGSPFQIQVPQVTFREVFRDDIASRKEDDKIDQDISDYLTYYLPRKKRTHVDSIERHYRVHSVFSTKILHDITKGVLKAPLVNGRLNEDDIVKALKPYEWLVPYDIVNNDYNKNHVKVYPHWHLSPIGLDIVDYDFYKKIISMYLREPLDTTPFIYITRT